MEDVDSRTVWVGSFDPEVTSEEVLYELFLQAGPLHYVKIPKDKQTGKSRNFGFVCYRHSVSVPYAIELLNGICVNGRDLRVQSRNHQHLQHGHVIIGGVHSLDPNYGKVQASGPSQYCGQQALMGNPSLLGVPSNVATAMAQKQMALLHAFQPIPLLANPLLNAPKERFSDRHGSLTYGRSNPYQRDNYSRNSGSYQRDNYAAPFDNNSSKNYKDKSGMASNMQRHHQGSFDFNRLGPPPTRDQHHSGHTNDYHNRHGDHHARHSHHNRYDSHRNSGRHASHHDNRNYR